MTNFSRMVLNSLLPKGAIWNVKEDADLDLLFDGIAENHELTKEFLSNLSLLRNPLKTTILNDLEKEYGISKDPSLSEDVRRQRLLSKKIGKNGNGTPEFIQKQLRKAGFDVYVYRNNPPVDPGLLLDQNFPAWVGGQYSYVGSPSAYVGATAGELVVNGLIFKREKLFIAQVGGATTYVGGEDAYVGKYSDLTVELNNYEIPSNPAYWPLIFFIGGVATYNTNGSLKTIAQAQVDIKRRQELISLIVKYKPFHTWCGLIVSYI